jgi:hypothetical protein
MKKPTNKEKYVYNSLSRIQVYLAGMCIGANLMGLEGREWHYDSGEKGREIVEKEINRLVKYLSQSSKT